MRKRRRNGVRIGKGLQNDEVALASMSLEDFIHIRSLGHHQYLPDPYRFLACMSQRYARCRASKPSTPAKRAEPMIAQTTGNGSASMMSTKISGRPNCRANHRPTNAPIKPTNIEITQPPRE